MEIFALCVDALYSRIDNMNALQTLRTSGIGQQLLLCQFPNRKLLERRRVDSRMALVGNHYNAYVWRKTTSFYSGGKSCNAIAHYDNIRIFRRLRKLLTPNWCHSTVHPYFPLSYLPANALKLADTYLYNTAHLLLYASKSIRLQISPVIGRKVPQEG